MSLESVVALPDVFQRYTSRRPALAVCCVEKNAVALFAMVVSSWVTEQAPKVANPVVMLNGLAPDAVV